MKDTVQCTRSNKINSNFGKNSKKKRYVDLIGFYKSSKDRPKFKIMLNLFSLKPPYQKVYITHKKSTKIANLVYKLCTTEYNHSQVLSLSILI